jgi:hypothetical protein
MMDVDVVGQVNKCVGPTQQIVGREATRQNSVGEPARVGHLVDRVEVLRASCPTGRCVLGCLGATAAPFSHGVLVKFRERF